MMKCFKGLERKRKCLETQKEERVICWLRWTRDIGNLGNDV